jgi:ligand-binding sensor domain-containing protein
MTGADGFENENPRRIWVGRFDDDLFVETGMGLYEYDRLFDRWYPLVELPDIDSDYTHIPPPQDLLPGDGISLIGDDRISDMHYRTYAITDVLDDNSGDLWIGTWGYGAGIAGSSARLMTLLPYGLLQNRVDALCHNDTLLWISGAIGSSYRTGLTAFHVEKNEFIYIESGVRNNFPAVDVYCLEADGLGLYVGTSNGLYIADLRDLQINRRISPRQGLADFDVVSLASVGDSLFIGTSRGLNIMNLVSDSISWVHSNQFLNRMIYDLEIIDDYLWIASDLGAYRLSMTTGRLQRFDDPHNVLFARVFDIERWDKTVWFASDGGVLSLNLETGVTDPFTDISRRTDNRALAVNDRIAAMASDRGMTVIFLDPKNRFSKDLTTEDGLASNQVNTLLLDGDYIWVGTDKGLTRFLWNNPERVD